MDKKSFIIFSLNDGLYAISVKAVKHIIRSVQLTYLPDAPKLLLGVLNLRGVFVPVVNIRKQFELPEKEIELSDRIIFAQVSKYTIAFIADEVIDVFDLEQWPLSQSIDLFPCMEQYIVGISEYNNRTVLVYDVDTLFPEHELKILTDALDQIKEPS